jgi:predicted transcriptional regulator
LQSFQWFCCHAFLFKKRFIQSVRLSLDGEKMQDLNSQVENAIFQALAHPMRRTILKIISSTDSITYSELITELQLPTGKLNYHLEQLEGLIEKNQDRHYILTPLGNKALNQLNLIKQEATAADEKYVKTAEIAQKTSLQPAVRSFLLVGIAFSFIIIFVWSYIAFIVLTEGAPVIVYALLPVLIAVGIGLLGSLIYALLKSPEWVRRLERRFLGTC